MLEILFISKFLFNKKILKNLPEIEEYNHEEWYDAEIYFGKTFRKNNKGEGCHEGACTIIKRSEDFKRDKSLLPKENIYTIYGAAWCPYCRRAKILLHHCNLPFDYIDIDSVGGSSGVNDMLVDEGLIPKDYKTIPKVFNNGVFLGGYSDLLEKLKKENIANDDIIKEVDVEVESSSIDFNKNSIVASINIVKSSFWRTRDEYIESVNDGAKLTFHFNPDLPQNDWSLFLIVEPPRIQGLEERQKEVINHIVSNNLISKFSTKEDIYILSNETRDKLENTFEVKIISTLIDGEPQPDIELRYPDRYYVGKLKNGSTCELTFQSNIRIFTFYITTEPMH